LQSEAGGFEAPGKAVQVGESIKAEFNLGFDGHRQQ
jgi:hypothetical protein